MSGLFGGTAPCAQTAAAFSQLGFQSKGKIKAATPSSALSGAVSVLPSGVWPITDQRYRNTCVAFAAAAAMEVYYASQGTPTPLSEDFLYNRMRRGLKKKFIKKVAKVLPDYDLGATLLSQAYCVFKGIGVCTEALRPYQQTTPPFNIDGADPTEAQTTDAGTRTHSDFYYAKVEVDKDGNIDPDQTFPAPNGSGEVTASDAIHALLSQGSAVAVGVPVYQLPDARMNWTAPATMRFGFVPYPGTDVVYDAALPVASGHAVCITGYVPVSGAPGGGYFVFRNSWGLDFRTTTAAPVEGVSASEVPPGFGVMSAAAVDQYVWELLAPTTSSVMDPAHLPQCG
ncbi:hypothetical protein [Pseudaestuariivita sp.]|uniref:hypothetical protein n=1 Tax=Pseudaestuariivita sp. TaxID=2211669 RepID=UPI00405989BB